MDELTLEYGMDSYPYGGAPDSQLQRFAQEIVPQVRENVARQREAAQEKAGA